jgi:hypothetical protein
MNHGRPPLAKSGRPLMRDGSERNVEIVADATDLDAPWEAIELAGTADKAAARQPAQVTQSHR